MKEEITNPPMGERTLTPMGEHTLTPMDKRTLPWKDHHTLDLQAHWVAGSKEQVCLSRAGQEEVEINIHLVWQVFGKEPVDMLYRDGETTLKCDSNLWALFATRLVRL